MSELNRGSRVAWGIRSNGKTVGVSFVHRVMAPGKTFCNHKLPDADVMFDEPLPPFLGVCSRCNTLCERALANDERERRSA